MYHARKTPSEGFRNALAAADDLSALTGVVFVARDMLRIDHLIYHWVNAPGGQIAAGTYPVAWQDRYLTERLDRIDPVVQAACRRFGPLNWKEVDWSPPRLRDFLAASADHGLSGQGLSLPVHGPNGEFAILTANHECDDAKWAAFELAQTDHLILVAHAVHDRARALLAGAPRNLPGLTPREAEVIGVISRGLSRAQAARSLRISEHTLRDHLESARRKLGARSTTHAVAQAISKGLVQL